MFFYLLMALTTSFFVVGVIALIYYSKGHRFFKSDEQRETEEGMQKAFGKDNRWGFPGGSESAMRDHSSHHSGSSSGYDNGSDSGGGGDGGGGGD
jgi:hypothetical protein